MKILVLVPNKKIPFVETLLSRNKIADSKIDIISFRHKFDVNKFNLVYVYPGNWESLTNNTSIKNALPIDVYRLVTRKQATLMLEPHYTADYTNISIRHIVVPTNLLLDPYNMLYALSQYPVYEKHEIKNDSNNFMLSINKKILCYVTRDTTVDSRLQKLMPIIPTSPAAKSNFAIESFFRKSYVSISDLKATGDFFWKLQCYYVWGSFYDTVY
jgi:hypothetical protein